MNFAQKSTLKSTPVTGSYAGGNIIHQMLVATDLTGLNVGHVVVIEDGVITQRWDGSPLATVIDEGEGNITMAPVTLGIVTTQQFDGDRSVSTLRSGAYIRDRIVLSDDSSLSASAEFVLSLYHLFAEGSWV